MGLVRAEDLEHRSERAEIRRLCPELLEGQTLGVRELGLDLVGRDPAVDPLGVGLDEGVRGEGSRSQLTLRSRGGEDLDVGAVPPHGLARPDVPARVHLDHDVADDPGASVLGPGDLTLIVETEGHVAPRVLSDLSDVELPIQTGDAAVPLVLRGVEDPLGRDRVVHPRLDVDHDILPVSGAKELPELPGTDDLLLAHPGLHRPRRGGCHGLSQRPYNTQSQVTKTQNVFFVNSLEVFL